MWHYIIWKKDDHTFSRNPYGIAIGSSTVGMSAPPIVTVYYPSEIERDLQYDLLTSPEAINEFASTQHGLPPAPVGTFLDFGDCAFDARDVLAASKDEGLLPSRTWVCRVHFRVAPDKAYEVPFDDAAARDAGYLRIITAMKASQS